MRLCDFDLIKMKMKCETRKKQVIGQKNAFFILLADINAISLFMYGSSHGAEHRLWLSKVNEARPETPRRP